MSKILDQMCFTDLRVSYLCVLAVAYHQRWPCASVGVLVFIPTASTVEMSRPSKTALIESLLVQLAKAGSRSKSTAVSYYCPGTSVCAILGIVGTLAPLAGHCGGTDVVPARVHKLM